MPDNRFITRLRPPKEPTGTPTATIQKNPIDTMTETLAMSDDLLRRLLSARVEEEPLSPVSDKVTAPMTPGLVQEVTKERQYRLLHSTEGLPAIEWDKLSPQVKTGLLEKGESVRPAAQFVGGEPVEGDRVEAFKGKPDPFQLRDIPAYKKAEDIAVGAAQTPITVGPLTMSAGEWAGLLGITIATGGAVIAGLPIAYNYLMNASVTRNINKWSMQTNTPVSPALKKAVADWVARTSKPTWANTGKAFKELFKPSATGKFVPTPQATSKADAYTQSIVKKFMPEFSKTRTDEVIAGIRAGKYNPDAVIPSVQAVQGVEARLGQPAEIRKTLSTQAETNKLVSVQAQAKKNGMDVEAVQGISPKEYWVGISLPKLVGSPEFTEWLITIRNNNPEAANKIEKLLVGKFEFTAADTRGEGYGRKRFIPFKNIEDAQRFVTTGDITAIASKIELKGQPMSAEAMAQARQGMLPDTERQERIAQQLPQLQKQLDELLPAIEAEQDIGKWKELRAQRDTLETQIRQLTQYPSAPLKVTPTAKPTTVKPAISKPVTPEVTPTEAPVGEVITEEQYLTSKGAPFMGGAEPGLHKNIQEGRGKQQNVARVQVEMAANNAKREALRKEYQAKVKSGEIRPPSRNERLIETARGNPDNQSVQAARRLLEKQGIDWEQTYVPSVQKELPSSEMAGVATPQPTPTAPQISEKAPEAVSEGIPPSEPPIPPETGITPEPVTEPSGRISFANLQDAQTVIDYSTKPDVSRWIANLPVVKQIMSKVNPSAIAGTPGEKAILARNVLREEGTQKAQGVISYLNQLGTQEKVFGKLDDNGFIASGKLKGLSVNDIRTYPKKYADKLSPAQSEWITRAHEIEVAKLKFMRDNGVEVEELTFQEGGEYAGRRVYALMSKDGELLDTSYVGAGPTRVGKKTSFEKRRSFATAKEALDAGYRYLPEDEALTLNVGAAYNRVADKQMSEWLLSQVPWRTTGAPEELVLAAEAAKIRTNSSKQLLAALNRAVRGERVPDATLNSIARTYPKEAAELKSLIPQIQRGEPTAKVVQSLTKRAKALIVSDNKDKWAAINARARAREAAMAPKFGEAMVMHPAFSGKIFTGAEAKQLAETMRNALEPKVSEALASVNKVNALVRFFKLAGDFSPLGIQLIFLSGQNPKIYGGAAASIPRILLDTEFQSKFLSEHKATIDRHPGLLLSTAGTEFTEAMAKGGMLSTRLNVWPKQEAMLKKLGLLPPRIVGKAGASVLQPFQRVFEGTLDYAGIKMAESLEHLAKTPAEMAEVDQFINEFRGLTSSAKLGVNPNWRAGETATLLAPRYNRAIAALLADATKGAASFGQSGIRNRLAIQGLTKGIAAVSAMALAISLALGEDEEDIKEHFDPNSTRFFTWTIAGTNIGPGTKVRSVVKLVAQTIDNPEALLQMSMDNPVLRFARGNLAPVLGSAISLLTGKDYIGDPVRSDVATFTREMLVKNFLPIWVENVVYEGGELSQRLLRGAGEFFGGRAYPETESDQVNRLRERYAAQDYGKKYEDLNNSQRDSLREKHNDLDEIEKEAKKMWAEKGSDIERFYYNEKQRITDERNAGLEKAAQSYLDGGINKYDYDKQRGYIRPYYSGGSEVLWSVKESLDEYSVKQMEKWLDENIKPEDKALGEYQQYRGELIETADLPVDWDVLERELESYLTKYSPDVRDYILDNMNNWINDLPPAAKQVEQERTSGIEDETWWDNYRDAKKPTTPSRSTQPSTSGGNRFWNK